MQVVTEHMRKAMSSFTPAWPSIQPPLSPWKAEVEKDLAHICKALEVKRAKHLWSCLSGQIGISALSYPIYYILHTSLPTPGKVVMLTCHHTSSFLWKNQTSWTETVYFSYPVTLQKINITVFAANIWNEIIWPLGTRLGCQQSGRQ